MLSVIFLDASHTGADRQNQLPDSYLPWEISLSVRQNGPLPGKDIPPCRPVKEEDAKKIKNK